MSCPLPCSSASSSGRMPDRRWRLSVFWVMRNRSLPSRWSSTRARWEALGWTRPGGTRHRGAGRPASRRVHTPSGPRKSGMPESVLMPAPVKATMCSDRDDPPGYRLGLVVKVTVDRFPLTLPQAFDALVRDSLQRVANYEEWPSTHPSEQRGPSLCVSFERLHGSARPSHQFPVPVGVGGAYEPPRTSAFTGVLLLTCRPPRPSRAELFSRGQQDAAAVPHPGRRAPPTRRPRARPTPRAVHDGGYPGRRQQRRVHPARGTCVARLSPRPARPSRSPGSRSPRRLPPRRDRARTWS